MTIDLVWERPEPARREVSLSRAKITRAAITLADKKGLDAVSLRNIGAALRAGPMRLYRYVATKDEVLELMVDDVYAELVAEGTPRGPWRKALRAIAHDTRRAAKRHPWWIDLVGSRPHLGPNALAYLEASLAALAKSRDFRSIDFGMRALSTLNAYAIGAIRNEASALRAERETGMSETEWQRATWPYIERMIATGKFPTLAKVVEQATHPSEEAAFDEGLECVLEGIAAKLASRARASRA